MCLTITVTVLSAPIRRKTFGSTMTPEGAAWALAPPGSNVVASIIGVQAGVDPLDDQFVQQVHSTAERIAEALAQQQRAVEYQAGG